MFTPKKEKKIYRLCITNFVLKTLTSKNLKQKLIIWFFKN